MNHTRVSIVITCSEYLGLLLFVLIKHKVEDLPFGMLGPRKFIGLTDFNWLLPILWRIRFLYANFHHQTQQAGGRVFCSRGRKLEQNTIYLQIYIQISWRTFMRKTVDYNSSVIRMLEVNTFDTATGDILC